MGLKYVAYDLLVKNIQDCIKSEISSHHLDPEKMEESLKQLSKNHPERARQCRYLTVVVHCLEQSKSDNHNKEIILNAATFYVYKTIEKSYGGTITPIFCSPKDSTLYILLNSALSLNRENYPSSTNLIEMYTSLVKFMKAHSYKNSDPSQGYLPVEKYCFSSAWIEGFNVDREIERLLLKINSLELKQVKQAKKHHIINGEQRESSLAGFLFRKKEHIDLESRIENRMVEMHCS